VKTAFDHPLADLLRQRIVILDGAMGTMVQRYKFSEEEYRGARFASHPAKSLKGDLELLQLTRPEAIEEIHTSYLRAGADVIETNTFSATTIGQHDFLFVGQPKSGRKDEELTASEVLSATSELLRALRLGPMELALWYRRRPDEEVYSESPADREQARKP